MASLATKHPFGIYLPHSNAAPSVQDRVARALEAGLRARRKIEKEQARAALRAAAKTVRS
jgi:hypothetical protein